MRSKFTLFVRLEKPDMAKYLDACLIPMGKVHNRVPKFMLGDWILDAHLPPAVFDAPDAMTRWTAAVASCVESWRNVGTLRGVLPAYDCPPTGAPAGSSSSQEITNERLAALREALADRVPVWPTLTGANGEELLDNLAALQPYLDQSSPVVVATPEAHRRAARPFEQAILALEGRMRGVALHGRELSADVLRSATVRAVLASGDSHAWRAAAQRAGYRGSDWQGVQAGLQAIQDGPSQQPLFTTLD